MGQDFSIPADHILIKRSQLHFLLRENRKLDVAMKEWQAILDLTIELQEENDRLNGELNQLRPPMYEEIE